MENKMAVSSRPHMIERQVFEVDFFSREEAHQLQNRLSKLFNDRIIFALEGLFNRMVPPDEYFNFDDLVIDIGKFNENWDDDDLVERIIAAVEEELSLLLIKPLKNYYGSEDSAPLKGSNKPLQLLDHFLLNGSLPWWTTASDRPEWPSLLKELFHSDKPRLKFTILKAGKLSQVRSRLAYQFDDAAIYLVLQLVEPESADYIRLFHSDLTTIQHKEHIAKSDAQTFKGAVWQFILDYLLVENKSFFNKLNFVEATLMRLATRFNISYEDLLSLFTKAVPVVSRNLTTDLPELLFTLSIKYHRKESLLITQKDESQYQLGGALSVDKTVSSELINRVEWKDRVNQRRDRVNQWRDRINRWKDRMNRKDSKGIAANNRQKFQILLYYIYYGRMPYIPSSLSEIDIDRVFKELVSSAPDLAAKLPSSLSELDVDRVFKELVGSAPDLAAKLPSSLSELDVDHVFKELVSSVPDLAAKLTRYVGGNDIARYRLLKALSGESMMAGILTLFPESRNGHNAYYYLVEKLSKLDLFSIADLLMIQKNLAGMFLRELDQSGYTGFNVRGFLIESVNYISVFAGVGVDKLIKLIVAINAVKRSAIEFDALLEDLLNNKGFTGISMSQDTDLYELIHQSEHSGFIRDNSWLNDNSEGNNNSLNNSNSWFRNDFLLLNVSNFRMVSSVKDISGAKSYSWLKNNSWPMDNFWFRNNSLLNDLVINSDNSSDLQSLKVLHYFLKFGYLPGSYGFTESDSLRLYSGIMDYIKQQRSLIIVHSEEGLNPSSSVLHGTEEKQDSSLIEQLNSSEEGLNPSSSVLNGFEEKRDSSIIERLNSSEEGLNPSSSVLNGFEEKRDNSIMEPLNSSKPDSNRSKEMFNEPIEPLNKQKELLDRSKELLTTEALEMMVAILEKPELTQQKTVSDVDAERGMRILRNLFKTTQTLPEGLVVNDSQLSLWAIRHFLSTGSLPAHYIFNNDKEELAILKQLIKIGSKAFQVSLSEIFQKASFQAQAVVKLLKLVYLPEEDPEVSVILESFVDRQMHRAFADWGFVSKAASEEVTILTIFSQMNERKAKPFLELLVHNQLRTYMARKSAVADVLQVMDKQYAAWDGEDLKASRGVYDWMVEQMQDNLEKEHLATLFKEFFLLQLITAGRFTDAVSFFRALLKFLSSRRNVIFRQLLKGVSLQGAEMKSSKAIPELIRAEIISQATVSLARDKIEADLLEAIFSKPTQSILDTVPSPNIDPALSSDIDTVTSSNTNKTLSFENDTAISNDTNTATSNDKTISFDTGKPSLFQDEEDLEDNSSFESDLELSGESFLVHNAGLVLLHPYLKPFFTNLGLLKEGKFISKQARFKAIHALQFLIDGEMEHPEDMLTLNKILCGWPVKAPIPLSVKLTKEQVKHCSEFLNAVISMWEKMRNSSHENFRGAFLKRDGLLRNEHGDWSLRVEPTGYDMLLQTLPWGFGVVKNSLMETTIYVEWI